MRSLLRQWLTRASDERGHDTERDRLFLQGRDRDLLKIFR